MLNNQLKYLIFFTIYLLYQNEVVAMAIDQGPNSKEIIIKVVNPISDQKILPDTYPLPCNGNDTLDIRASRGEYEPASFVLRSKGNLIKGLIPTTSGLVAENEYTIPASQVDIKLVKVWYQAGGAWKRQHIDRKSAPMLVPELLLNDPNLVKIDFVNKKNALKLIRENGSIGYFDISATSANEKQVIHGTEKFQVKDSIKLLPINLPANFTQQYWITVKVPSNAPAGDYRGAIILGHDNGILGEIKINVHVYPFDLMPPQKTYSIYYRGYLTDDEKGTISSEGKSRLQLEAELINMREHGIMNPTVYQRYSEQNDEARRLLIDYLDLRCKVGIVNLPLYFLGRPTGNPATEIELYKLHSIVKELLSISKRFNNSELYMYGIDEAKDKKLTSQRMAWEVVHKAGAKVFAAGYKGHHEKMGKMTDLLIYNGEPDEKEAEKFHRLGAKIFSYSNPQTGPENPLLFRRNFGILLWQKDYDGAMNYAYQHSFGSIWNDFDHEVYRDHVLAYPTENGVIDTIAWEGFREGVDDIRYITTLEYLIEKFEGKGKRDNQIVKNASDYLKSIKRGNSVDLDIIRNQVSSHITNLLTLYD